MSIDIKTLARGLQPANTSILFGAGSSLPSGGPTTAFISEEICNACKLDFDRTLSLADVGTLAELSNKRRTMIDVIQRLSSDLVPTKGLLNLPLYDWKSIYTTNYDDLIEKAYRKAGKQIDVYSSNFDFGGDRKNATPLFKVHGTLGIDRVLGHQSSMVISTGDYELSSKYREIIFDSFLTETSRNDFLVVGHSLADPDLNEIINEAVRRKKKSGAPGLLYALIYTKDENRAALVTAKGFNVAFGGIDELFHEIAVERQSVRADPDVTGNFLDVVPTLNPVTVDITHSLLSDKPNPVRLFNGGAARYGDIKAELTFSRDLAKQVEHQLAGDSKPLAYILGPAGFGKSTVIRQVGAALSRRGFLCWEHIPEHSFDADGWQKVARKCMEKERDAVLLIDDAHLFLRQIDTLVDSLAGTKNRYFRVLLTSSPPRWHPRSKSPNIFRIGTEHTLGRLSPTEINSLLNLFESKQEVSTLVEQRFSGFSRQQRFSRLADRCGSDMFVCMKNIFGFDQLDDIILKEYAEMDSGLRDIYRTVAAMEACQIRVHRQMVIRVTGFNGQYVKGILQSLEGIIEESEIDSKNGIYGWHGRHQVISEIVLKYKYAGQQELFQLFETVIDSINPSYEIERHTINEICDVRLGIGRLKDRDKQNYLYRKLISIAPSQRVPRHRLIYNQIIDRDYEPALSEIRLFEKELRIDAPVIRYKGLLKLGRAKTTDGIMDEDRLVILDDALNTIDKGIDRFPYDKSLYGALLDVALEIVRLSGIWEAFDLGMLRLQKAADDLLDPEMQKVLARYRAKSDNITKGGSTGIA